MSEDKYAGRVRRGAVVNAFGLLGKVLYPLLFLAITWLGGPQIAGLYLLAVAIAEMGASAVQAGFSEAIMVFASPHVESAQRDPEARVRLYRVLATGFLVPVALGVLVACSLHVGARTLVDTVYPGREALVTALPLVGWTMPFLALSQACIASTKAHLHMELDAWLNGFLRPLLLLLLSTLFWQVHPTLASLVAALFATYAALAMLAVLGLARCCPLPPLLSALRHFTLDRQVLRFAVPQGLCTTCEKYLTRIDLMMLGALGYTDFDLGLYGSAAMLTSNLREVRLIFSGAIGPVVARYHAAGDHEELEALLGRVSRWVITISAPLVLLITVLRTDLLGAFDSAYATADTRFVLLLLAPAFLNCAFGLIGNCIMFTGHSVFNLLNAVCVAGLNTLFNYLLIPRYGLLGAALATALASLLVTILQSVELKALEQVRLRVKDIYKPLLGFCLCAAPIAWDPPHWSGSQRVLFATGLPFAFLVSMLALRHDELMRVVERLLKSPRDSGQLSFPR